MSKFGIAFTAIYIGVIVAFRWASFPTLATIPLNEFGDFFAGVFGPLMLFWLILGYIQQQNELRQNTKALELQAEELKKSVEQHEQLVSATKEQTSADLKALDMEEQRSKRETHPHFTITSAGLGMESGDRLTFDIYVLNSGQPASGVSFSSIPEIKQVCSTPTIPFFAKGKSERLRWENHVSGEAPNKLQLIVNCNDANTAPYTKVFYLVLDEENQYSLTDTS